MSYLQGRTSRRAEWWAQWPQPRGQMWPLPFQLATCKGHSQSQSASPRQAVSRQCNYFKTIKSSSTSAKIRCTGLWPRSVAVMPQEEKLPPLDYRSLVCVHRVNSEWASEQQCSVQLLILSWFGAGCHPDIFPPCSHSVARGSYLVRPKIPSPVLPIIQQKVCIVLLCPSYEKAWAPTVNIVLRGHLGGSVG